MSKLKYSIAALVTVAALATGALVATSLPAAAADADMTIATTPAEHLAEAAKYEQEALDLDVKAAQHSKRAALSAARGRGGSKQATSQSSISKHCERLAKAYRAAAAEARELAKTHREMAQPT